MVAAYIADGVASDIAACLAADVATVMTVLAV